MNIYQVIILTALIFDYFLNLYADYLNLKTLNKDLPEEFHGVYDAEIYQRSQDYTRAKTRFRLVTTSINLAVILIFWFSGGFNLLDQMVRGWKLGPIWSGLLYIGILVGLSTLINLPFQIYATFVIEERFGFNKMTVTTFVCDLIKSLLLAIIFGGILLTILLTLFQSRKDLAWVYCWGATAIFFLFTNYIAPTWIMPLFWNFKPLESGELKEAIHSYIKSINFPVKDIYIIDGSRRSSKANAFFTGYGKNKRIALYDTLVEKHPLSELVAILAHEIGHYKLHHITKGMLIRILHTGFLFFLLSQFIDKPGLFQAFFMKEPSVYAGFVFFALLYTPIEFFLSLAINAYSRRNELMADLFAAKTSGNPEAMVNALKHLSANNLTNLIPHPFFVILHYSHPPILDRIKLIRNSEI